MEGTEIVYAAALECIASGLTREETRRILFDNYPSVEAQEIEDETCDALRDALRQGVEREDIDPSWF